MDTGLDPLLLINLTFKGPSFLNLVSSFKMISELVPSKVGLGTQVAIERSIVKFELY